MLKLNNNQSYQMEFLDLNLETIQYIYDKLAPISAAMFASTCSSLISYYPYEAKHRKLMKRVFDDINALDYTTDVGLGDPLYIDGSSSRNKSYCVVTYMYERRISRGYATSLLVKYHYKNLSDSGRRTEYMYDGKYPNINKFREFRTTADKSMWSEERYRNIFASLRRRHIPGGTYFRVEIDVYTFTPKLFLYDQEISPLESLEEYLPPWADKSQ
jgi:hypothetical protein